LDPNKYKNNSTAIGYISALVAAILFGSVSTMGKAALSTIDPLLLSSLVYLISAATLTPLAHRAKFTFKKRLSNCSCNWSFWCCNSSKYVFLWT